jgi:hypothetical protein
VVSFMPRQLYPQGKSPSYPLDRRLNGSQSRSGYSGGEEKNSHPHRDSNPRTPIVQPLVQRYTTELSRFSLLVNALAAYPFLQYDTDAASFAFSVFYGRTGNKKHFCIIF